jgi:hypothetical protein
MKKLLLALLVAAVAVPAATAGGWATVGLSSLPPSGLKSGQDWPVDITVLQHGRTPLAGAKPTVTVRNVETGAIGGTFVAKPTGKTGVYRTVVRFPASGTWTYEVYDGFTQYGGAKTHTFEAVRIGADDSSSGFPIVPAGGALLGFALIGAVLFVRRSRLRPEPAIG